jgi:hypothetical protein
MYGKKTKILAVAIGVVVLAGGGAWGVVANDRVCFDPLTEMIRQEVASGVKDDFLAKKAAELPFLEQLEAKMCARSSMTRAQLNAEHAAMKPPPPASNEIPTPIPNTPLLKLGVIYDERDPLFLMGDPGTGRDYVITAEFVTKVQNEIVEVYSGYHSSDPLQGEVYATIPGGGAHFYPTPDATGPAKLVSVNGSVLTIETLAGNFDKQEAGGGMLLGKVVTKGGSRYEFDLVTRSFR